MSIEKQGTVTAFGQSKNGKPTVTIDGQLYYLGRCSLQGVTVGDRLTFEASAFGTRGDLWGLDKWGRAPQQSAPQPAANGNGHAKPMVSDEAVLRFVSNCVGSAITAGTIKDPSEIEKWFSAARAAWNSQMVQ